MGKNSSVLLWPDFAPSSAGPGSSFLSVFFGCFFGRFPHLGRLLVEEGGEARNHSFPGSELKGKLVVVIAHRLQSHIA